MLSERHNNPVMCAASRLILSAVEDAYARRVRPAHCLVSFAAPAPSRALACRFTIRQAARILDDVLLGGRVPSSSSEARRTRRRLASLAPDLRADAARVASRTMAGRRARRLRGTGGARTRGCRRAGEREATKLRRQGARGRGRPRAPGAPMRAAFLGHVDDLADSAEIPCTYGAEPELPRHTRAASRLAPRGRAGTETPPPGVVGYPRRPSALDARRRSRTPEHLVDVTRCRSTRPPAHGLRGR